MAISYDSVKKELQNKEKSGTTLSWNNKISLQQLNTLISDVAKKRQFTEGSHTDGSCTAYCEGHSYARPAKYTLKDSQTSVGKLGAYICGCQSYSRGCPDVGCFVHTCGTIEVGREEVVNKSEDIPSSCTHNGYQCIDKIACPGEILDYEPSRSECLSYSRENDYCEDTYYPGCSGVCTDVEYIPIYGKCEPQECSTVSIPSTGCQVYYKK